MIPGYKYYPKQKKMKVIVEFNTEETEGIKFFCNDTQSKPQELCHEVVVDWMKQEIEHMKMVKEKEGATINP